MKVLITGITGFVGSHVADFLSTRAAGEVYGIKRWRSRTENIEHLEGKIILKECDLRDASSVRKIIEEVRPDRIFHIAGQSHIPTSWHAPEETISTSITAELNLFEAVRPLSPYAVSKVGQDPLGYQYLWVILLNLENKRDGNRKFPFGIL